LKNRQVLKIISFHTTIRARERTR